MERDRRPPRREVVPRGAALLRRVLLAEVLGPPRGLAPWTPLHPPSSAAEPEPER